MKNRNKTNEKKSGFEPIPKLEKPCYDMEHNPPMHIYIPQGQQYRHVCPSCGKVKILCPPQITF